MSRPTLTRAQVMEVLDYDPDTGVFRWKLHMGKRAGSLAARDAGGGEYRCLRLVGAYWSAHRVAWLVHYGEWPPLAIDHINGVKHDNRIANLRMVSATQNLWNTKTYSNNTSGFRGVSWKAQDQKWCAYIKVGNRNIGLGRFDRKLDAARAYDAAVEKYRGPLARRSA